LPRLELHLLGSPSVKLDGEPVEGFAIQKARALLYFLATESGQVHTREALVALLWPEAAEASARTNLRQALANLREAIDDETAQPPFLITRRDSLQFNFVSQHWSDIEEFHDLLDACLAHGHRHPDRCGSCARRQARAIEFYRGDFLSGFHLKEADPFEEWSTIQRERLRRRMAAALSRQATFYEIAGDMPRALDTLERQLSFDPWMEEAHRERMRLLALSGRRSEALAQYETCRRVLFEELGVAPAPETVRLHAQVRDGSLDNPAPQPAAVPNPLPRPSTPFIGREHELAELVDLLENPAHRLITVMGGGGIGKSRLALEAARLVRTSFADAVAMVRMSTLADASQIPAAILAAMNVDPSGHGDPVDQLLDAVRDRELLLIIDGPESMLASVRALVTSILDTALKAAILVTSLERLGLQAEWCYEVGGLRVDESSDPGAIHHSEAVRLFLERGRRIQRRLGEDDASLTDIHRICRLLEGSPLAIELAASAIDRITCRQIADDLEAGLGPLASTHYDLPDRHRSLAAAMDFAWARMSEEHQRVLRCLSVFQGGWEAEAAEQVAGAKPDDLQALSDRSMIRRDRSGRFSFHALMQQHAAAELRGSGEETQARHRHLACCLELAERAAPEIVGPGQVAWLPRLDQELANLRGALTWGTEQGEAETVARLCLALARYWMIRGYLAEGQEVIERLLALPTPPPEALLVKLYNRVGILAAMQRRFDQAEIHVQASIELARRLGDTQGEVMSLNSLGAMSIERGEYEKARGYLEKCLPIWQSVGNANGLASTLNNLGAVELLLGDYPAALTWFEQSLPIFRELGDRRMIAGVLYNLGDLSLKQGDVDRARLALRESLALRQEIEEVGGVAETLEGFARASLLEDRAREAARLFGAASVMREAVGAPLAPVNQADYDRAVAKARCQLGDEAFLVGIAAGRAMTPDLAIALALDS
jgi:DNA-binding SARP family transcriptional activator/predicted ATPase